MDEGQGGLEVEALVDEDLVPGAGPDEGLGDGQQGEGGSARIGVVPRCRDVDGAGVVAVDPVAVGVDEGRVGQV